MSRKRPTIADLRAIKGKRQLTMLRVMNLYEAEAAERADTPIRRHQAGRSSNHGDQEALHQQLADDSPAAGADRHSHRHFPLARCGARQQKVGDICTSQQ